MRKDIDTGTIEDNKSDDPQEKAYWEGVKAWKDGHEVYTCPYVYTHPLFDDWVGGYADASESWEEDFAIAPMKWKFDARGIGTLDKAGVNMDTYIINRPNGIGDTDWTMLAQKVCNLLEGRLNDDE